MRRLLVLWLCVSSAPAFAKCEDEVSIDVQYEKLTKSNLTRNELDTGITQLLNAAFTPYLVSLEKLIREVPAKDIRETAKQVSARIKDLDRRHVQPPAGSEFDGRFEGEFMSLIKITDNLPLRSSFTGFSKEAVRKFHLAVLTTAVLERDHSSPYLERSINRSHNLRARQTYTETDMWMQMYFGYLSAMQSAAAFTAERVGNWTAEQMLKEVMRPGSDCLSPVLLHSLMLPPRMLGENGPDYYRRGVLSESGDRLVLSTDFKDFLKTSRLNFLEKKVYEYGKGCPVAHKTPGMDQPGLQKFLDAIMYVYEIIE